MGVDVTIHSARKRPLSIAREDAVIVTAAPSLINAGGPLAVTRQETATVTDAAITGQLGGALSITRQEVVVVQALPAVPSQFGGTLSAGLQELVTVADTTPVVSSGLGTAAQAVTLLASDGSNSGGKLTVSSGTPLVATATLNADLVSGAAITTLPATVGAGSIASGTTLLIAWGGYSQAFVTSALASPGATSISTSSVTPNFAYPSGWALASSTALPYLKFPASPPVQVTGNPGMRFIIHNWSPGAYAEPGVPTKPWLLNSDGTLFAGNGGYLCLVEPGQRNIIGSTSWGVINQTVPGTPTASMRVAFQNLVTTGATGHNIAVNAWMV